jgi:hypothetical protein
VTGENAVRITGVSNRTGTRLHGDELIAEVMRNMEEGLFRIRGKTLVPAIYRIYLHPEDYEPLRDVSPFVVQEIRDALNEHLEKWNRAGGRLAAKLFGRADKSAGQYVRLTEAWTVEIHPDLDARLAAGEIEIYSELGAPDKREYGAGSKTRRISPRRDAPPPAPPVSIPSLPIEVPLHDQAATKPIAFAWLRFVDETGPRVFEVTRNQVVIGRGGRSYWVDLKLETLPDVSREHCRIRHNPDGGLFTIEDVSQFGTLVNGNPVGQNAVMPLPKRATISLAGVIELQWEAA